MDVRVFYLHLPCTPAAPARPRGCAEQSRRAAAHTRGQNRRQTVSCRPVSGHQFPARLPALCRASCLPMAVFPARLPPLDTFLRSFLFSDLSLCGESSLFVRYAFWGENGFLMGKRPLCGRSVLLRGSPSLWETRLFKRAIPCGDPIPFLESLVPLEGIHPFAGNHFFRGKYSLCKSPSL